MTQRTRLLRSLPVSRPARAMRPTAGPTARLAAALAIVGALGGCGGSDSTAPSGGVTGQYNIVSVTGPQGTDDKSPFVLLNQSISGQQVRAEITSGSITLGSGNRYDSAATVNFYVNGIFAGNENSVGGVGAGGGGYTLSGTSLTLRPDPTSGDPTPAPVTGTLNGGTMSFTQSVDDATFGVLTFTIVLKK